MLFILVVLPYECNVFCYTKQQNFQFSSVEHLLKGHNIERREWRKQFRIWKKNKFFFCSWSILNGRLYAKPTHKHTQSTKIKCKIFKVHQMMWEQFLSFHFWLLHIMMRNFFFFIICLFSSGNFVSSFFLLLPCVCWLTSSDAAKML